MLHIRPSGTPRLRVLKASVPDLEREIKRYKKKVNYVAGTAVVTDTPNTKGEVHLCQCLEYLCAYNPKYHAPSKERNVEEWWVQWAEKRRKNRRSESPGFVSFGPLGDRENDVSATSTKDW